jgi:hypothetical protein
MLSFFYNILEFIVGLVFRFWRRKLKVEGLSLHLVTDSDDDKLSTPYYRCRMTIINRDRDAIYTEHIALTINEEKTYKLRDGSDRIRIDTRAPLRLELCFPLADPGDAVTEGRFCVEIKPMSGKTVKTHGCFPIDYNAATS